MKNILHSVQNVLIHKKIGWTIFLDIISKGLPYLFLPFFIEMMTISEFGIFTHIVFISISGASLMQFGFETAKSKLYFSLKEEELGRLKFSMNVVVFSGFIILLLFSTSSLFLTKYILKLGNGNLELEFFIIVFCLINAVILLLIRHYSLTKKFYKFQIWNLFRLLFTNLILLIIFYFIFRSNLNAETRLIYEVILNLLFLIPLYYFYQKEFIYKFDVALMKKVFKISFPILIGAIIGIVYNLSDKYFVNSLINTVELAKYNYALLMIIPLGLTFTPFFDAYWVPKFFSENKDSVDVNGTKRISIIFSVMLLGFMPIFIGCVFLYTQLTQNKIDFYDIAPVLVIVYLSKTFDMITQFYNNFFILAENTKISVSVNIFLGFLFLGLSYILINYYGIIGAAIALLITSFLKFILYYSLGLKIANSKLVKN